MPQTIEWEHYLYNLFSNEPQQRIQVVKNDIDYKYEEAFKKDEFLAWYQQSQVKEKSYTFVVFGPPKVGKSTFVSAITSKETTSHEGMEQGTISEQYYTCNIEDGKTLKIYDTPGIEISSCAYKEMGKGKADELYSQQILKFKNSIMLNKPICAIFCISSGANFNKEYLIDSLKFLQSKNIITFYIITNMYNLGNNSKTITDEMIEVCQTVTKEEVVEKKHPNSDSVYYKFGDSLFGLKVNSIQYQSLELGITMPAKNLDLFFFVCLENINPEKVLDFIRCTYRSKWFPRKACISIQYYSQKFLKWLKKEESAKEHIE